MALNEFLTFATAPGANVQAQIDYVNDVARYGGFTTGLLISPKVNKTWRQANFVAACTGQMISDILQEDVLDDGNVGQFVGQFIDAIRVLSGGGITDAPLDGMMYGRQDRFWVRSVAVAGDALTGFLTLHAHPTDPMHAATRGYVDQVGTLASNAVQRSGDTMTGRLFLDPSQITVLAFDEGTMGFDSVQWNARAVDPYAAATKQYVDSMFQAFGGGAYVPVAGGSMTGDLDMSGNDIHDAILDGGVY